MVGKRVLTNIKARVLGHSISSLKRPLLIPRKRFKQCGISTIRKSITNARHVAAVLPGSLLVLLACLCICSDSEITETLDWVTQTSNNAAITTVEIHFIALAAIEVLNSALFSGLGVPVSLAVVPVSPSVVRVSPSFVWILATLALVTMLARKKIFL